VGEVVQLIDLPGLEPRGAIVARVQPASGEGGFILVAAHLGLNRGSRHKQFAAILEATRHLHMPVVMAGDLNERAPTRLIAPFHRDLKLITPGPSFHASRPFVALDHMILSGHVRVARTKVHTSPLAHVASDHLPIWADLAVAA
jgi:endonuclease/exonuclease/phosphatase family metal-dependent hydrolase